MIPPKTSNEVQNADLKCPFIARCALTSPCNLGSYTQKADSQRFNVPLRMLRSMFYLTLEGAFISYLVQKTPQQRIPWLVNFLGAITDRSIYCPPVVSSPDFSHLGLCRGKWA